MYLSNKYSRYYNKIIERAKHRPTPNGYTEKHHIIPKSLGGNNRSENIVILTAREHFICHRLLTKFTTGKSLIKMKRAAWRMTVRGRNFQYRYRPNSRTYDVLRKEFGSLRKGIKSSEETNRKISEANSGKPAWNKGIPRTIEERKNISLGRKNKPNGHIGLKRTAETREKLSLAAKNRERKTCPHCNITCTPSNYTRWHDKNCKHKISKYKYENQ